jgi:hypothetical protein
MKRFSKALFQTGSRFGLRLILGLVLLCGLALPFANTVQASPLPVIPTFSIVSAITDTSVTIQTANFPASEHFTIRMGLYGTLGVNGVVVGTTDSGAGGSFQATYVIPDSLKGQGMIAIRMDNDNGYYYSYNWFFNKPGVVPTPVATPSGGGPVPVTPTITNSGIPTFTISSVSKDNTVVVHTNNYPANEKFTVSMGNYGTYALNGIVVATTDSGTGGSFEATYTIPDSLKGQGQVAVRMDSSTGYYYSYNWFYNVTTIP